MYKLFAYSAATLGTLSLFVVIILSSLTLAVAGDSDAMPLLLCIMIGITIIFNFILLFVSPFIQDFIYRFFYKVKWFSEQEFATSYPQIYEFVKQVTAAKKFKMPKFGLIDDRNPQAFCYGSNRANGRVVFTEGILHYLAPEEVNAVIAHELGHIYNRDFIVMTIASTLLQILYETYRVLIRVKSRKNNPFPIIAMVAYVFYLIGTYVLLFLSRTREYLADRFSAETTQKPEALANALFKIAYGITEAPDNKSGSALLESTRALGIIDIKNAKATASYLTAASEGGQPAKFEHMFSFMTFDLKSPWAFWMELSSTHPLTAKRIMSLFEVANNTQFINNMRSFLATLKIDYLKLYGLFALDFAIKYCFWFMLLVSIPLFILGLSPAVILAFIGISMIINAFYAYPFGSNHNSTVAELMQDVYASPVRGKAVTLDAKIIGRGSAGYILGEDMMIQDKTGIIFVDVRTVLGFLSNIIFALSKFKKLINQEGRVEAYFFRGVAPWTVLAKFQNQQHIVNSYPKLWSMIFGAILIVVGVLISVIALLS